MVDPSADPTILIPSSGLSIPQSAFGLYRVPASEEGESIILDAVKVRERAAVLLVPLLLISFPLF
jgi:hypothetical protein